MFVFYASRKENGQYLFDSAESRHCSRVLRLLPGADVLVSDGEGNLCRAVLTTVDRDFCSARPEETLLEAGRNGNRRPQVHIVMAPTKSMDRTEWFLEKATEVGLGRISFIHSRYSERKAVKEERVRGILLAAMKQSQQAYLPLATPLCGLEAYLRQRESCLEKERIENRGEAGEAASGDPYPQKFIAYCGPEYPKRNLLELLDPGKGMEVLIGPEGDFHPGEVAACVEKGYVPVNLGPTRLRTETAALFAAWAPAFLRGRHAPTVPATGLEEAER